MLKTDSREKNQDVSAEIQVGAVAGSNGSGGNG